MYLHFIYIYHLIKWLTTINNKIAVYKSISVWLAVCVDQVIDPSPLAVFKVYPRSDPNAYTVKIDRKCSLHDLFFAYFNTCAAIGMAFYRIAFLSDIEVCIEKKSVGKHI